MVAVAVECEWKVLLTRCPLKSHDRCRQLKPLFSMTPLCHDLEALLVEFIVLSQAEPHLHRVFDDDIKHLKELVLAALQYVVGPVHEAWDAKS